jgi:hypothetical protein
LRPTDKFEFISLTPNPCQYRGQLSSAQFGLVFCPESDLLGGACSGEVGKGIATITEDYLLLNYYFLFLQKK